MAFTRKALKDMGIQDDQVEKIMTLHGTSLSDYIPQSDVQGKIDSALADYKTQNPATKLTDDPDYKKVFAENEMLKAFSTDDFAKVKKPYRDIVWGKLDHADKHKPYAEQMPDIAKEMPDLFEADKEDQPPQPPAKPAFGVPTQGTAPDGTDGQNFADFMSFIPKKK